ncbi:MAG: 30S ribosomal protein S21 [Patescibacteria group bacterium]|jgi:hypothetical protein
MVEVRRRERESTGSLLRRFNKKIQRSGILLRARALTSHKRAKSKLRVRRDALKRQAARAHYAKLEKLGKLEEKPHTRRR